MAAVRVDAWCDLTEDAWPQGNAGSRLAVILVRGHHVCLPAASASGLRTCQNPWLFAALWVESPKKCRPGTPWNRLQPHFRVSHARPASVDRRPAQQDREVIHNRWQRDDWGGPGQRSWLDESPAGMAAMAPQAG